MDNISLRSMVSAVMVLKGGDFSSSPSGPWSPLSWGLLRAAYFETKSQPCIHARCPQGLQSCMKPSCTWWKWACSLSSGMEIKPSPLARCLMLRKSEKLKCWCAFNNTMLLCYMSLICSCGGVWFYIHCWHGWTWTWLVVLTCFWCHQGQFKGKLDFLKGAATNVIYCVYVCIRDLSP